jgi:hypothetical protein
MSSLTAAAPSPNSVILRLRRAIAFALPRSRTSLRQAFVADRFLLWTTVALLALACVPLFLTPFLPFSDLGINTASADLIWDTAAGVHPAATFYDVQFSPLPYWTTYGLCAVLGKLFGPLVAAKLLTALILAIVPLGTMRLLLALGRDARLGLWAFAVSWEHNLYAGWMAMMLGVGLASFVLAWMLDAETPGDGARIAPYAALIGLTHVQATWLFGLAGGVLTFTSGPLRRRLLVHAIVFAGTLAVVVPWLVGTMAAGGGGGGSTFTFEWHSPAHKLSQFFAYSLDNFTRADAERAAAVTFVVLVVGPLLLGLLPAQPVRHRLAPVLLLGVAAGLYALLPFAIGGPISHWYTYPRYSTVVLLWLLLIPRARLRGWATAAVLPGVLAALLMDGKAIEQFASFGQRTRPYLDIIAQVPPKAAVLAVVLDDNDADPDLKLPPYHQFYAYITAFGHGYSPYLWNNNSIPLIYRPGTGLPAPGWNGVFSMDAHGKFYDYVMVQGHAHGDPIAAAVGSDGRRPRLISERDRWRLYSLR